MTSARQSAGTTARSLGAWMLAPTSRNRVGASGWPTLASHPHTASQVPEDTEDPSKGFNHRPEEPVCVVSKEI